MALSVSRKHGPEAQNRRGGAPKGVRAYGSSARCCAVARQMSRHCAFRRFASLWRLCRSAASPRVGLGETAFQTGLHVVARHASSLRGALWMDTGKHIYGDAF